MNAGNALVLALKEAVGKPKLEEFELGKAIRDNGLDKLFPDKSWPLVLAVQVSSAWASA